MILDTMSSTWRFQQMYKASQLTKQRRTASLKMIRNHISNTNIKEFCTTCNQDKIPQAVRMFFPPQYLITVAHLFPDNWFALVVNSKILQALPTFFHLDYQEKQIVTENLLGATTTFGPQRGSLFATFPPRTTRYFIIIRETPRNELLTKKPAITLYQQSN